MERYEINDKTIALYGMNNKTRVYEENKNFVVDKTTYEIMEDSCAYFGSSLEGRKKGTNNLTENQDKICNIWDPTSSPKIKSCSWLRSNKINRYYYKNNRLIVEFKNGDKIPLDITYDILDNQVIRSIRLETVLKNRKLNGEEKNNKFN